jgi:hypothetical protein
MRTFTYKEIEDEFLMWAEDGLHNNRRKAECCSFAMHILETFNDEIVEDYLKMEQELEEFKDIANREEVLNAEI